MIQGFCRVGCETCGRWLLIMENGMATTVAYPDLATDFPSVPAAAEAISGAGWTAQTCLKCHRDTAAPAAIAEEATAA